jgi:PAS domain S-box-containing protein
MSTGSPTERMAMLAAIIESSEDAIVGKNLNGIITSWNKGAQNIFGFTEKEAVGKHISLIIPPERIHEEEMIISKLRQGQKIEHFETIRRTKTGRDLNISLSISPIRNENSEIVGASKLQEILLHRNPQKQLSGNMFIISNRSIQSVKPFHQNLM